MLSVILNCTKMLIPLIYLGMPPGENNGKSYFWNGVINK